MLLLNTNTREYKKNMEQYIFDCINNEDLELNTIQDKLKFCISEFKRVANYETNLHNIPNNVERMADYLMGLPFDFAFSDFNILKDAALLHNLDEIPEDKKEIIVNQWFKHISLFIFKLCDKYKIKY